MYIVRKIFNISSWLSFGRSRARSRCLGRFGLRGGLRGGVSLVMGAGAGLGSALATALPVNACSGSPPSDFLTSLKTLVSLMMVLAA
jgi:hypothetical protein